LLVLCDSFFKLECNQNMARHLVVETVATV